MGDGGWWPAAALSARLCENLPLGLALLRGETYILVNRAWAEQLGFPPSEADGRTFLHDVHPADRTAVAEYLASTRTSQAAEFRFRRQDRQIVTLEVSRLPSDVLGQDATHGLIGRDVTRLRSVQGRRLTADRMMSIGTLAAGVAHDINNPLTYIMGNLTFLAEEGLPLLKTSDEQLRVDLEQAISDTREGVKQITDIVANLNQLVHADHRTQQPVDMVSVVEQAISMTFIQLRRRARLVRALEPVPPVYVNRARAVQVLINLLLSSAQTLPEGRADEHEVRVATRAEKGRVVLELSDTGPGIARELLGHVFDPFSTASPRGEGLGLGLPIAHSIVRDMGGTLTAHSDRERGATFRMSLPARREGTDESVATPPPDAAHEPDLEEVVDILVIDDETKIARALTRGLRPHDVYSVYSGRAAIALLQQPEVNPDVILCDLLMPEESGIDVYEWIRKNRPGLERRIIFMTGGGLSASIQKFLDGLDNLCVLKPIDMNQVRSVLAAHLYSRG